MASKKLVGRELLVARLERRIASRRKNIANAKSIYSGVMKKLNENLNLDIMQLNSLKHGKKGN